MELKDVPYGQHIALTCANHPDKRWSTKNIMPIGSRSIFYNLADVPGMGAECDCPLSDLIALDPQPTYRRGQLD